MVPWDHWIDDPYHAYPSPIASYERLPPVWPSPVFRGIGDSPPQSHYIMGSIGKRAVDLRLKGFLVVKEKMVTKAMVAKSDQIISLWKTRVANKLDYMGFRSSSLICKNTCYNSTVNKLSK